jgi:hypothetical protein
VGRIDAEFFSRLRRSASMKQPPQQQRVDSTAKAYSSIDFHDWDARTKPFVKFRIGVDIDYRGRDLVGAKQLQRFVTQVTTMPGK